MRSFETRGPVYPEDNYIVARTDELSDFINRLEKGRYVVLFAPRQTGKTTFFHRALEALPAETYFPVRIDFQAFNNLEPAVFYEGLYEDIREAIEAVFKKRESASFATFKLTDCYYSARNVLHIMKRLRLIHVETQRYKSLYDVHRSIPNVRRSVRLAGCPQAVGF